MPVSGYNRSLFSLSFLQALSLSTYGFAFVHILCEVPHQTVLDRLHRRVAIGCPVQVVKVFDQESRLKHLVCQGATDPGALAQDHFENQSTLTCITSLRYAFLMSS